MGKPCFVGSRCCENELCYGHADIENGGEGNPNVSVDSKPAHWFEELEVQNEERRFQEQHRWWCEDRD